MEKQAATTSKSVAGRKRALSGDLDEDQAQSRLTFQGLPNELKMKIFEYFSHPRDFLIARSALLSECNSVISSLAKFPEHTTFIMDFKRIDKHQYRVFGRSSVIWQNLIFKNAGNTALAKLKKFGATEEQCAKIVSLKFERSKFTWYNFLRLLLLFPSFEELALVKCEFFYKEFDRMDWSKMMAILDRRRFDWGPIFRKVKTLEMEFAYMADLQFMLSMIRNLGMSLNVFHVRFEPKCELNCAPTISIYADMLSEITDFVTNNSATLRTLGVHFNNVSNWASTANKLRIQKLLENQQLMDGITSFGAMKPPVRKVDRGYHVAYLQSSSYTFNNGDYELVDFALRLKNLTQFNVMVKLYRTCPSAYWTMLTSPEISSKIRFLYINLGCKVSDLRWFHCVEHLELFCGHCNPYHNSSDLSGTLVEKWPTTLAMQFSKIKHLHMVRPKPGSGTGRQSPHLINFAFVEVLTKYMIFLVCVHFDYAYEMTDTLFVCKHENWGHTQNGHEACSRLCSLPNLEDLKLKLLRSISAKAIIHGFKFPKLKRLNVTGMPAIDPEVIMSISTNNKGLEECKLRWDPSVGGALTRQQWTTYWNRFRSNLIFIQRRKLKLAHNNPDKLF